MAKKKVTVVAKKKKKTAAPGVEPKAATKAEREKKGLFGLPSIPRLPDLLDFPAGVADSAREIWMAGIGALSSVEEAGSEWFDGLVKKGERWESESRKALTAASKQAGAAAEGAQRAAGDLAKKPMQWSAAVEAEVQRIVEQSVEGVLHRMNVPTHDEVQELIEHVQTLTGKVDALSARMKLDPAKRGAQAAGAPSAQQKKTAQKKTAPKAAAPKPAPPLADDATVYHVVPHEDGWAVEKEGGSRATSVHGTKAEAVSAGRDLAKSAAPGRLVLHRQDGTIQDTYSYGDEAG